jgi:glycosyltransferase 2 family protein
MKNWKLGLGILISALFLYLAFRKVDFAQMGHAFAAANYWWLIPTVAITFVAHGLRTLRWRYLLEPIHTVPFKPLFSALMIGYLFNDILPAHLGEFVRAYVIGKKQPVSSSAVFGTIVMERIIDVLTLFLLMAVTMVVFPFPDWVRTGGYLTFLVIAILFIVLLLLKKYPGPAFALMDRLLGRNAPHLSERIIRMLESFLNGIMPLRRLSHYFIVALLSLVIWACYGAAFQLVLYSFDFIATYQLPWTAALVLLVITTFGVLVPSSPGYVGTYHWLCLQALALSPFNVPNTEAMTFAIVMHGINFLPIIVVGLLVLSIEGLSFKSLKSSASGAAHPE